MLKSKFVFYNINRSPGNPRVKNDLDLDNNPINPRVKNDLDESFSKDSVSPILRRKANRFRKNRATQLKKFKERENELKNDRFDDMEENAGGGKSES